jgi:hypothetical protein
MLTGSDEVNSRGEVKLWRADFYTGSPPRMTIPPDPRPLLESWLMKTALRFDDSGKLVSRYETGLAAPP